MGQLFETILNKAITDGTLQVTWADGKKSTFGNGTGESVAIRFKDKFAERRCLVDPDLGFGELFTDGRLVVERGSIYDFIYLLLKNTGGDAKALGTRLLQSSRRALRKLQRINSQLRSRSNVAHHYDLDSRLYRLFLDPDWQYSCAYFERPGMSLDAAQLAKKRHIAAKKRHIAAKLDVTSKTNVLDIGCGWGGLSLYLAGVAGAENVKGVTLSEEQLARAMERSARNGLEQRVRFEMQDYRDVDGQFDRIVSVGMFEHVGLREYPTFFENVQRLLKDDGVALLHTIGFSSVPQFSAPWIDKYIFPGGYIPALSEIVPEIEKAGLVIADLEILQGHYQETLRHWHKRFLEHRDEARAIYDERFCRMWEFYLAASEAAFRCERMSVFQFIITKKPSIVPTTRDGIGEREAVLKEKERALPDRVWAHADEKEKAA